MAGMSVCIKLRNEIIHKYETLSVNQNNVPDYYHFFDGIESSLTLCVQPYLLFLI
jgi:hypothetical protein